MKVIIENTVCLNTGDAAILMAIRHILRSAFGHDLKFLVFDSQPDVSRRLYPSPAYGDIEFRRLISETVFKYSHGTGSFKDAAKPLYNKLLLKLLRIFSDGSLSKFGLISKRDRNNIQAYRDADMVITTGGTYLVETYNLEKRLNQFELDDILGKTPIFFTQSLGPFRNPTNRQRLKQAFDKSELILLRDAHSKDNISEVVADIEKCHVVADSVFALADTARIQAVLSAPAGSGTGVVAISVRNWNYVKDGENGMGRYIDSIRAMATVLVRAYGKKVVFVSTCQGVPEYAHDDSKTAKAIYARLDPDVAANTSVDDGFHSPEQLMAMVKGFDFVVATRMHMMIMSLCVGTPVLPIAYEFKTKELSARLGIAELTLDINTVTAAKATEILAGFVSGLEQYRQTSLSSVLEEHASAMSVVEPLKQAFARLAAKRSGYVLPAGQQVAPRGGVNQSQNQSDAVV
ncbi:polysaccharide pyruvyl transferase family protein [Rhizobium sp. 007]|uniref:polysaccharide pyruvyl transferase family protein n=1 Tax=Rhizobium sp. 007 TaxID=2785056 RepID=UPI00188FDC16|nr:polysaccharide pyruvyl transferase family protein [Rhizobium sp. 007]QPB24666.1 polysaccharide pyruvyl transferase family protein [Rhizobium sp. 007]